MHISICKIVSVGRLIRASLQQAIRIWHRRELTLIDKSPWMPFGVATDSSRLKFFFKCWIIYWLTLKWIDPISDVIYKSFTQVYICYLFYSRFPRLLKLRSCPDIFFKPGTLSPFPPQNDSQCRSGNADSDPLPWRRGCPVCRLWPYRRLVRK